jgi:hypothetical protein
MIKNMTRKGLAIGAAMALGLSALVATPSQALVTDTRITLAPAEGGESTNLLAIEGAYITLDSSLPLSLRSAGEGLKILVQDPDEVLEAENLSDGEVSDRADDGSFVVDLEDFSGYFDLVLTETTSATYSVKLTAWFDDNDNNKIGTGEVGNEITVTFFKPSEVATSVVVTQPIVGESEITGHLVTLPVLNYYYMNEYLDVSDPDDFRVEYTIQGDSGTFDAAVEYNEDTERFEFSASVENVVEIVETALIQGPFTVGESTAMGKVDISGSNLSAYFDSPSALPLEDDDFVDLEGFTAGTATAGDPVNLNGNRQVKSTTGDPITSIRVQTGAGNNLNYAGPAGASISWSVEDEIDLGVIAGTYSFTPYLLEAKGATSAVVVAAPVAVDGTSFIADDANNSVTIDEDGDAVSEIRAGTLAATATMTFFDANELPVGAGRSVRVMVDYTTDTSLMRGVKVNGVAVEDGDVLSVLTNAAGQVTAVVTATRANAGATLTLTGEAEGQISSITTATFDWESAAYKIYDLKTSGTDRAIAVGGSYTFDLLVVDQWGVVPAATVVNSVRANVTGGTTTIFDTALSAGRASVTVTHQQTNTGVVTVELTPGLKAASGAFTVPGSVTGEVFTLTPRALTGAAISITGITAAGRLSPVNIQTIELVAGDKRLNPNVVVATAGGISIAGKVTDSITAAQRAGASVTVSGPANVFFTDGSNRSAFGSLTVVADTNGDYAVYAHSNISQEDTVITVSSEGASREVKITFNPALGNSGTSVVIAAPNNVLPGSTLTFVATVTDKFGNAVDTSGAGNNADVVVVYDGPGFPIATPTETDADGKVTFRVLLGSGDRGTAKLTVTYRKAGAASTAAQRITESKTVTIGATAARGWTRFLAATNELKIYARDVVGAGKVQFIVNGREIAWIRAVDATDPKLNVMNDGIVRSVFVRDMLVGRNVVEIYVNGVRLDRRIFTR